MSLMQYLAVKLRLAVDVPEEIHPDNVPELIEKHLVSIADPIQIEVQDLELTAR